jgi:DNA-binding NarL/FixJ family response regulator
VREVLPITVLVVEDEPEFMRRFTSAVLADPGLALAGSAATARAAIALIDACPPDVVLLDLGLPHREGVEVIRHAMRASGASDVLVATMFDDDQQVLESIEAGASGYLLKDSLAESIVGSIHDLREGGSPISPGLARRILERFRLPQPALTARETELLRLTSRGMSCEAIGGLMGMSPRTLVAQVRKIYRKMAIPDRELVLHEGRHVGQP